MAETGLTKRNVTHLGILLLVTLILALVQTLYLDWHQDAVFPFWRAVMTALAVVLQVNFAFNEYEKYSLKEKTTRAAEDRAEEKRLKLKARRLQQKATSTK
eukprot:m.261313 g.261313  ORF g.261313 m.261313 type:complete len:101 (-) comp41856_c0_seq1:523-825(-)